MGYLNALTTVAARATRILNTHTAPVAKRLLSGNHGQFTVRAYAPSRYGDPHENAAKILKEQKLDKHAFPTWQDLANFFAKNNDPRGIAKAATCGRWDGEHVFIPRFKGPIISIDPEGKNNLATSEIVNLLDSVNILKTAQRCVETKTLDGKIFTRWSELRHYLHQIDEWRLHMDLARCKTCVDEPIVDTWDAQFADAQTVLPDQNGSTKELPEILAQQEAEQKAEQKAATDDAKDNWLAACVDCHNNLIGTLGLNREQWVASFIKSFPSADQATAEKAWRVSIKWEAID